MVVAELRKVYREQNRPDEEFRQDLTRIKSMCVILEDLPIALAEAGGCIRANPPHEEMGLVDCLLLALARSRRGWKLLTCDSQFHGVKEAVVVGS